MSVAADSARSPILDEAARSVAYWYRPAPRERNARWATVPVRVGRSLGVDVGEPSGEGGIEFLAAVRSAVAAAAHEHAFDRLAADSAPLVTTLAVLVGRDGSGARLAPVQRVICAATPMPGSPVPAFPAELLPELRSTQTLLSAVRSTTFTRGSVRATFVVDSLGVVDVSSFTVGQSTDPAFTREVRRILPLMRYFPATIDGRPSVQIVTQEFDFERR